MRSSIFLITAISAAFALLIAPNLVLSAVILAAVVVFGFRWITRRRARGVWR